MGTLEQGSSRSCRGDSRRFATRCFVFVQTMPAKGKMVLGLGVAILVLLVSQTAEVLATLQVPSDVPVLYAASIAMFNPNERVKVSSGVKLHAIREFSRLCCEFGPTVYKAPGFIEKKLRKGWKGEGAVYNFVAARTAFEMQDKKATTVFVPIALLDKFLSEFFIPLDKSKRVVLVTGQEDCGPVEVFGRGRSKCGLNMPIDLEDFLADERLFVWFAQNYDAQRCETISFFPQDCGQAAPEERLLGKMRRIPIGLDFHTLSEKQWTFFGKQTPREQEQEIMKNTNVSWDRKPLKALAVFSVSADKPDRSSLLEYVSLPETVDCIVRPDGRLEVKENWHQHNFAAFVFSPQGNGVDTHRFFEALALHSVPVVRTSPLDELYREYPVVILNSWKEFSSCKVLERWKRDIQAKFGTDPFKNEDVMRKITLAYWQEVVLQQLALASK